MKRREKKSVYPEAVRKVFLVPHYRPTSACCTATTQQQHSKIREKVVCTQNAGAKRPKYFFLYQKNHLGRKMANKNNNPRWQQQHSNDMKIKKKKCMYLLRSLLYSQWFIRYRGY